MNNFSVSQVYLVSHMCPGANERDPDEAPAFQHKYSERYLQMIRRFANCIVGQFCGHLHSDTFRIVYDQHTSEYSKKKIPFSDSPPSRPQKNVCTISPLKA